MANKLLCNKPTGFDGFGPSILVRQLRGRLRGVRIPDQRMEARKILRENCPLVPGVYGWLDGNRRLTYVGKSKSLCKRLLTYFAKKTSESKMERIRQNSRFLVWEPISHELLALIREQELIHRWRPEFNSMGQPTRMQPAFLCIGGSPAPNARLARRIADKSLHSFGPISGTKRLREAIISLNQVFQLRDCPDKTKFEFGDQRLLFDDPTNAKCIRHELGSCPGPCAGKCSSVTYQQLVDLTVDFLKGNSQSTLDRIAEAMNKASQRLAFETAAIYRDRLEHLTWLDRRLRGLRMAEKLLNGVLPIGARRNRTAWIILRAGRICSTVPQPDRPERAESTQKKLSRIAGSGSGLPTDLLEMSLQLIVISWFRKHTAYRQRLIDFDSAIDACHQIMQSDRRLHTAA